MKSNLLKLYIFAFLFIGDFVMFAQGDDPGATVDCPSGDCPEVEEVDARAPINTKLIWLAIIGISFAFYYYNRRKEEKQIQQ